MKVIELDALISALNKKPQGVNYMRIHDVYNAIRNVPVYNLDADTARDVVLSLAALDHGKARFFEQYDGTWYDCNDGSCISFEEMLDRAYDSIA